MFIISNFDLFYFFSHFFSRLSCFEKMLYLVNQPLLGSFDSKLYPYASLCFSTDELQKT